MIRLVEDVQEELNVYHYHEMYEDEVIGTWERTLEGLKYIDLEGNIWTENDITFVSGWRSDIET